MQVLPVVKDVRVKAVPQVEVVLRFVDGELTSIYVDGYPVDPNGFGRAVEELRRAVEAGGVGWLGLALSIDCTGSYCVVRTARGPRLLTRMDAEELVRRLEALAESLRL